MSWGKLYERVSHLLVFSKSRLKAKYNRLDGDKSGVGGGMHVEGVADRHTRQIVGRRERGTEGKFMVDRDESRNILADAEGPRIIRSNVEEEKVT